MKSLLLTLLALVSLVSAAQTDDPAVMTINGKAVPRSEFEYSYKKNNGPNVLDHKTLAEYVDLYINYKLKVEAALDAHLDTLSSYRQEFRQYRDQQVLPTLVADADMEREAQHIYQSTKDRIGPDGLRQVQHILIMVKQSDSDSLRAAARDKALKARERIVAGKSFDDVARGTSEDRGTAMRGGNLGWISRGQTVKAFEEQAFALADGEMSQPVQTEFGYHIIKVLGRKQLEPYDSLHSDIMQFIERRQLRNQIAAARLDTIAKRQHLTTDAVMDQRTDSLAAADSDARYLIQEYHDGLLLYEIANRHVWELAARDSAGLERFFKKNKKQYTFAQPRYRGIVYYTRDADDVPAVAQALKGKKFDKWAAILRTTFNNDSVLRIRAEKGIYQQGDNGTVDSLAFHVTPKKKPQVFAGFPNTAVYGTMITKPQTLDDVRPQALADYQQALEQAWVAELRQRYTYTVNQDVLATIPEIKP